MRSQQRTVYDIGSPQRGNIVKIGVFCHMYYAEMFDQFTQVLRNLPAGSALHLSTCSQENASDLLARFSSWDGRVDVRVVENRGRDLAPKLITFKTEHANYDCVLHLHTKGSIPEWRNHILKHLAGSRRGVSKIIADFERNPQLGIVAAPCYPPIRPWIHWGPNRHWAASLAFCMGIDPSKLDPLDFPAGSMFWARPAALAPLLNLDLRIDQFAEESGQTDGTIGHAIERLFYVAANHAGYASKTVPLQWSILNRLRAPSEALLRTRRLAKDELARQSY